MVSLISQLTDGWSLDLGFAVIPNTGIAVGSLVVLFVVGYILFCKADKFAKKAV